MKRNVITLAALAMLMISGTANAHRRRWHTHVRPYVTIVSRPAVTLHVSNRFSQKDRLAIAIAYLESHGYLTFKQYAKMTKLAKITAEAELDAFASDKNKPITAVIKGKQKVYVKV